MIKYYLQNENLEFLRSSDMASGYDLRADIGTERAINPGERWLVSTGLYLEMPIGVEAQVRSRSGLSINHGVAVLNAPGTIDADYRGEVKVTLINHDRLNVYVIHPGDRIAQLVFAPVLPFFIARIAREELLPQLWIPLRVSSIAELSATDRGSSGHGSTGR